MKRNYLIFHIVGRYIYFSNDIVFVSYIKNNKIVKLVNSTFSGNNCIDNISYRYDTIGTKNYVVGYLELDALTYHSSDTDKLFNNAVIFKMYDAITKQVYDCNYQFVDIIDGNHIKTDHLIRIIKFDKLLV